MDSKPRAVPAIWPFKHVYYGWGIVGVLFLAGIANGAGFNTTIGIFIEPMTAQFGWNRSELVGAITLGTMLGGVTASITGLLLDRFGPRWILFTGFLIMGSLFMSLSQISLIWHFYLIMTLYRLFFAGVVNFSFGVVTAKWFVRKRGRAVSIASMGQRLGGGLSPLVAQAFIAAGGWRAGMVALGGLTWAFTLLPTSLFLRRQPEDLGLEPDGEAILNSPYSKAAPGLRTSKSRQTGDEVSFTVAQALRTRTFPLILLSNCSSVLVRSSFGLHALAFFTGQGLSPGVAVGLITTWYFISAPAGLTAGFVADRVHIRRFVVTLAFIEALAMLLLSQVHDTGTGVLFVIIYGIVFGAGFTAQNLVMPNYFGRAHIGAIRGVTSPFLTGSAGLGPLVIALVFDFTGSYAVVPFIFVALKLISGIAMLMVTPPSLPDSQD